MLRDTDMNDVGEVRFATPVWGVGDVFTTGDGRKFRIHDILELPEQETPKPGRPIAGVWVVEPAD